MALGPFIGETINKRIVIYVIMTIFMSEVQTTRMFINLLRFATYKLASEITLFLAHNPIRRLQNVICYCQQYKVTQGILSLISITIFLLLLNFLRIYFTLIFTISTHSCHMIRLLIYPIMQSHQLGRTHW